MRTLPLTCPRRSYLAPALSHMMRNSRSSHSSSSASSQQTSLQPATTDSGFILAPSPLSNPFTSDFAFQRVLASYLPPATYSAISPLLTEFAEEAISPEVNDWIANAERQQPYIKQYDVFGRRYEIDRLVTSHGWKEVGKWGVRNGCVTCSRECGGRLTAGARADEVKGLLRWATKRTMGRTDALFSTHSTSTLLLKSAPCGY